MRVRRYRLTIKKKINKNLLNIALLGKHTPKGPSSVPYWITLSILDWSRWNRYQSISDSQINIFPSQHFSLRPCVLGEKPRFSRTDQLFSQKMHLKWLDFTSSSHQGFIDDVFFSIKFYGTLSDWSEIEGKFKDKSEYQMCAGMDQLKFLVYANTAHGAHGAHSAHFKDWLKIQVNDRCALGWIS